jgi:hypothetical protein
VEKPAAGFKGLSGIIRSGRPDLSWRGRWDTIWRVRRFVVWHALGGWNQPWLGAFIRQAWQFRSAYSRKIVLHYAPELGHEVAPELLLLHWTNELKRLEARFAFRLWRVQVFLFPSEASVAELFGPRFGGVALASHNAIIVGWRASSDEIVRHELVHLFADRWNSVAPPLLSEGLAVHLQERWKGQPLETAIRQFGSRCDWSLRELLDPGFFFDPTYRHACYAIAGSFSGFLIDEFGWATYRRLYRCCLPDRVEWAFRRSLGVSFQETEELWRRGIPRLGSP